MTSQKTITEMVCEMCERADQYEQQFSNSFGSDPFHAFNVQASIQKMRDDADNLEAARPIATRQPGRDAIRRVAHGAHGFPALGDEGGERVGRGGRAMNKSYNMNIDTGEKTWLTPPEIIEALGPFDLDPCCPPTMPWRTAAQMVHLPNDGLKVDWTGKRVWCNPPYGRDAVPFLRKMAENKTGGGILLYFARTDSSMWHDLIFPNAYGILFLRGRVKFCRPDGTPANTACAPSALVAYSERDFARLRESGLRGAFLRVCEGGVK